MTARQPSASASAPPAAAPSAIPPTSVVRGHVSASVAVPGGAIALASWLRVAISGAMTIPAGTMRTAIASIDGASSAGRKPSGSSMVKSRWARRTGVARGRMP
jgi:hypothetical protein